MNAQQDMGGRELTENLCKRWWFLQEAEGKMGQEGAVHCWSHGAARQGGWGGNGAGHLIEKLRNRVGFQGKLCMLWLRRKAGGIP